MIRLNVPGEVRLGVSVGRPRASRHADSEEFEVVVRNTGNVLFTSTGAVRIDGGKADVTAVLSPSGIYVIPGGQATLKARWEGVPTVGRRTARAELDVSVANKPAGTFSSAPLHLTFFPWAETKAGGATLLASVTLAVLTRGRWGPRLRRRRDERKVLAEVRAGLRRDRE